MLEGVPEVRTGVYMIFDMPQLKFEWVQRPLTHPFVPEQGLSSAKARLSKENTSVDAKDAKKKYQGRKGMRNLFFLCVLGWLPLRPLRQRWRSTSPVPHAPN